MPNIRVLPEELCFETQQGESVFNAARRVGLYWPTSCGGHGLCGLCVTRVVAGAEGLAPPTSEETARIEALRSRASYWVDGEMRLACCAVPSGDLVLEQHLVRKKGASAPSPARSAASPPPRGLPGWNRLERVPSERPAPAAADRPKRVP